MKGAEVVDASLGFRLNQRRQARAMGLTHLDGWKFFGEKRWWAVPDEDLTVPLEGEVVE